MWPGLPRSIAAGCKKQVSQEDYREVVSPFMIQPQKAQSIITATVTHPHGFKGKECRLNLSIGAGANFAIEKNIWNRRSRCSHLGKCNLMSRVSTKSGRLESKISEIWPFKGITRATHVCSLCGMEAKVIRVEEDMG